MGLSLSISTVLNWHVIKESYMEERERERASGRQRRIENERERAVGDTVLLWRLQPFTFTEAEALRSQKCMYLSWRLSRMLIVLLRLQVLVRTSTSTQTHLILVLSYCVQALISRTLIQLTHRLCPKSLTVTSHFVFAAQQVTNRK